MPRAKKKAPYRHTAFSVSVDFDQTRPKHSRLSDIVGTREGARAVNDRSNGKPIHDELIVGEVRLNGDSLAVGLLDSERHYIRHIGAVEVNKLLLAGINDSIARVGSSKLDGAVADVFGDQVKRLERLQLDFLNVGARAGNNEALESGERKLTSTPGQERLGTRPFALDGAVEPVLLAFLANDGRNSGNNASGVSTGVLCGV